MLWIADGERHVLAFRAHHAVVDGEGFFASLCGGGSSTRRKEYTDRTDYTEKDGLPKVSSLGDAIETVQTHEKRST